MMLVVVWHWWWQWWLCTGHCFPSTGYGNIKGSAKFADPDDPLNRGELIVGFSPCNYYIFWLVGPNIFRPPVGRKKRFAFGDSSRPNYSVVGTDYTSYAVVYTCNPFGLLKKGKFLLLPVSILTIHGRLWLVLLCIYILLYCIPKSIQLFLFPESLWILTRDQLPSKATVQAAFSWVPGPPFLFSTGWSSRTSFPTEAWRWPPRLGAAFCLVATPNEHVGSHEKPKSKT